MVMRSSWKALSFSQKFVFKKTWRSCQDKPSLETLHHKLKSPGKVFFFCGFLSFSFGFCTVTQCQSSIESSSRNMISVLVFSEFSARLTEERGKNEKPASFRLVIELSGTLDKFYSKFLQSSLGNDYGGGQEVYMGRLDSTKRKVLYLNVVLLCPTTMAKPQTNQSIITRNTVVWSSKVNSEDIGSQNRVSSCDPSVLLRKLLSPSSSSSSSSFIFQHNKGTEIEFVRRPFSPVEVIYRGWRRMEDRAGGVCRSCLPHSPGAATTVYLRCVEKAIGDA
ncbi:hypothetical protein OUZ56_027597 [Daphnia magna]|uniref:Uncharacterized protein n=1 Tax=Daphnia magna TaxID=35525 RepID=A0ABR0B1D8_9CRUS|nr:hypothetical protein OUZ56_027597 [Daphnia magna]